MKATKKTPEDDSRPEYDFDYSKGIRGKYYKRLLEEGSNVVVLEPDVAVAFRDSAGGKRSPAVVTSAHALDATPDTTFGRVCKKRGPLKRSAETAHFMLRACNTRCSGPALALLALIIWW